MASVVEDNEFFAAIERFYAICRKTSNPQECYEAYQAWRKEVDELPLPKPVEAAWLEVVISAAAIIAGLLAFVSYLPQIGGGALISIYDLGEANIWWGIAILYALLTLMYIPARSFEGWFKPLVILSGATTGFAAYVYMLMKFTGDVGTDDATFWGHVASILHPIFFLLICGYAGVYALYRIVKNLVDARRVHATDS